MAHDVRARRRTVARSVSRVNLHHRYQGWVKDSSLSHIEEAHRIKSNYVECYNIINNAISDAFTSFEKLETTISKDKIDKRKFTAESNNFRNKSKVRIVPNIRWPSTEEFTPELGKDCILNYITVGSY